MTEERAKLKAATIKAAKAITDLIKVVENQGAAVSAHDIDKVFAYLGNHVEVTASAASIAHARALSDDFDFDKVVVPIKQTSGFLHKPPGMRDLYVRGAKPEPDPQPDVDDVDGVVFLDDED